MSNDITLKPNFSSDNPEFEEYIEDIEINFKTNKDSFVGSFNSWAINMNLNRSNVDVPERIKLNIGINGTMQKMPTFILMPVSDDETEENIKVKGYDFSVLFDKEFEIKPTFPITLGNLAQQICDELGVEIETTDFINNDFVIYREMVDNKKTYREVIAMIAAAAAGNAFINEEDKLVIRSFIETDTEVEEYFASEKLVKVGPITGVNIAREPIKDYKTLNDADLLKEYKSCVVKIINNALIDDNRELAIESIFNQLKGMEFNCKKIETHEAYNIKPFSFINLEESKILVDSICIKYPSLVDSYVSSNQLNEVESNLNTSNRSLKKRLKDAEAKVDEVEGKITLLATEVTETEERVSGLEIDVDGLKTKVEAVADVTKTISSGPKIEIPDAVAGNVLELHIFGNNTVFSRIYPSNTLYPSDTLLPIGSSVIRVTFEDETYVDYDLQISSALKQNGAYYDEFVIKDGKSYVLRRIQDDNTIIEEGIIENEREFEILLKEGKNTVEILNYTANMICKYACLNDYTDVFATKVEMNSAIKQTEEEITANVIKRIDDVEEDVSSLSIKTGEIDAKVAKKVGKNEIIANLNVAVKDGQGIIELIGNVLKIVMDNFQLTEEGDMTANSGTIAGWIINKEYLGKGLAGIQGIGSTTSDDDVFYAGKGLGYNGNPAFHVTNQGNTFVKSLNIKGRNSNDTGKITIYNTSNQIGTTITDSKTESYYMLAGNGGTTPTLGKCMHGYNMNNDFRCLWQDTKLYFIVDDSNIGYVTTSSSDARLKEHITDIPQELLYVIEEIELKQFKLVNGTGKFKFGIIAQDLVNAFKKYELDYKEYEIISEVQLDLTDETLYFTIDYEQLLILKNQLLDDRVKALEKKVENILEKLEKLGEV